MTTILATLATATGVVTVVGGIVIYETIRYPIACIVRELKNRDGMH